MSKGASRSDRSQMWVPPKERSAQMAILWPAALRLAMRDQARQIPSNHVPIVAFLLQLAHAGGQKVLLGNARNVAKAVLV